MQNNLALFLKNKYFLALCLYLKKDINNKTFTELFIGYKNNYLVLNIPLFIRTIKILLNLIKQIATYNGTFLFLATNNKILDYIIQQNCLQLNNSVYLASVTLTKTDAINKLIYFPDLIISTSSLTNQKFLHKIRNYNIPTICLTSNLNLINQTMYTLILNNQSLYSNLIFYTLIFKQIQQTKKILGVQYFNNAY